MGLIDKAVSKYMDSKRKESPYEYDYLLTPTKKETLSNRYTRTMLINSVWYAGNDLELKRLYQRDLPAFKVNEMTSEELNYFWAQPTEGMNIRKIHSGVPQLISEKMVDLLLSNGYDYTLYKDRENDERDEKNQERLESILYENNFDTLLQEAIETESWSGGAPFKLSYNKQFTYPIIELVQPEEYEGIVKAGRIVEDVFIKYFNRKNGLFKLKERYGVDDKGSYIKYELYRHANGGWIDAKLTDLEETKDFKDTYKNGVYDKFSLYKPNKLPNSEFRGSKLGESDYSGSHGMFDALDETLSAFIQEFRDGKIKNFWPSELLPVDPVTNKQYIPPALKKDFINYQSGIGQNEKATTPTMVQGEIHTEKYIEAFKKTLETILNNAGLSPQTVGVTGLESTAASESSQELREKVSIRTRNKKVALWERTLIELFTLVLKLDDIKNGKKPQEYDIAVNFNDYKIASFADKVTTQSQAVASGLQSIKGAVEALYPDLTEEEIILKVVNIKIEKGINVFTKEEEIVYKKHIIEVESEEPEVEEEFVIPEEEITEEEVEE